MGYALDLLNKDYEIQKPLSNDLYNPILLGVAGFASIAFSNFIMRRPLMSGKKQIPLTVNIQKKLCKLLNSFFKAFRDM